MNTFLFSKNVTTKLLLFSNLLETLLRHLSDLFIDCFHQNDLKAIYFKCKLKALKTLN